MAKSTAPKTQVSNADVAAFIAAVADPERRADCQTLLTLMQQATGEKARLWGPSIVGYVAARLGSVASDPGDGRRC